MKKLDVRNMQQLQDYAHRRYFVRLRPNEVYGDLFVPDFWAYHRGKLSDDDLIRVVAHDGRWDVTITVKQVKVDGIVMQRWPIEPSAEEMADAAEIGKTERVVPFGPDGKPTVRVEHLPATGWRVRGLYGEISSGHKDETEATKAMSLYLRDLRYVLPSADEQAAEMKRHEEHMAVQRETTTAKREMRRERR